MVKKKSFNKKMLVIILILLIGILTLWKINQSVSKKMPVKISTPAKVSADQRIPVNVFKIARQDFKDTLLTLGTVRGGVEIELRFETEGKIIQFRFREGDRVMKDEIIAQLDQRDAFLKLKQAKNELEQHKKLLNAGAIIPLKLEQIKNLHEQAKLELEKTNLRAPRTGLIANKEAEIGEFITPNTKIAVLVDMEKVLVEVGIIEKDINKLILMQPAKINFDAYPGFDFYGKVYNIPPDLGDRLPVLQVKIQIENPDALILPGMFARTLISVYEDKNVIVIPVTAIDKSAEETQVFVVGERNRVSSRNVNVTYSSNEYAIISQGLEEGELVVADKPESLNDGAEIEIIEMNEYQGK